MNNPLIDIHVLNSRIILDMRYATEHNVTGKVLYSRPKAYLRKSAALKLDAVQSALEKRGLGLKIWDAYRPLSVQYKLWEIMPDERYVANPARGSAHNRGGAVDVTLVDALGKELEMPTAFDDFSERAHLSSSDHDDRILAHRELLLGVMVAHGFDPFETEWWHYSDKESASCPLETISFEELEVLPLSQNPI